MWSTHIQSFASPIRTPSLHRIKTAFSSTSPRHRSRAVSPSSAASASTSPLSEPRTRSSPASSLEDLFFSDCSPPGSSYYYNTTDATDSPLSSVSRSSSSSRLRQALRLRAMRRKPSLAVIEMEEERKSYAAAAVGLLEPRPESGMFFAVGGIFEVLEGKA